MNHPTLGIVIPAFNEERSIGRVIERLLKTKQELLRSGQVSAIELFIVDDGSTDQTATIIRSYREVQLIQHGTNRGYGAALKTGFEHAQGQYIAFLDADQSYRPESLPQLLEPLLNDQADLVIGSRMMGAASGMPRTRYIGNWIFARLLGWLVGQRITDSASGMRVFRRSVLPALLPLPDGLNLTPAMSARALHEGTRVREVSIPYDARSGQSKLRLVKDGMRFFSSIVSISRLYNPLKLFGVLGLGLIASAVWLGLDPVIHYVQVRHVEDTSIYRLVTVMVVLVTGINVVTFGAFCNHVLVILYPRRPAPRDLWSRVLIRKQAVRPAGWIGALLIVIAVFLNHRAIYEYALSRHIHVHWSYILTGATLFLTGAQLVMSRFLLTVLEELCDSQKHADV